jgi:exosome complex component RRP41
VYYTVQDKPKSLNKLARQSRNQSMISLAGLREDGRRPQELRQISVQIGQSASHDGSAVVQMGQTRVMAQVVGPHEVDHKRLESHEHGIINVEITFAPFASVERKRRRAGDRQLVELSLAVQQSLAATVILGNYPHTQIDGA